MAFLSQITLPDGTSYSLKAPYALDTITMENGVAALHDHSVNRVDVQGASCTLQVPAGASRKSRDFVVYITTSGASTYLAFSSADAGGTQISWLNGDPSGNYGSGVVLLGITELSQGVLAASDLLAMSGKEDVSNKVTSLSSSSTDAQYPSAKCVYDLVGDINSVLDSINGEVI